MQNATVTYIKKDGLLVPASETDASKLKLFNMSLKEGSTVDVYLSLSIPGNKTLGQLAKIHAMMRELANLTGHSFEEIKNEIKRKTGLYVIIGTRSEDKEYKSFSKCSKDELSKAIESCIEIGQLLGHDLN